MSANDGLRILQNNKALKRRSVNLLSVASLRILQNNKALKLTDEVLLRV